MRELARPRGHAFGVHVRGARSAALALVSATLVAGCSSSSSAPSPPPPPLEGCQGRQPSPTAGRPCGCNHDCDVGETCTGYPTKACVLQQVCQGRQPSPTLDKACGCHDDCELGELCADEPLSGFPGGICAHACSDVAPCPDGYLCQELTAGDPSTAACLVRCTATSECRPGYLCAEWLTRTAGGVTSETVCQPHCSSAADCTTSTVCDPYYGLCGQQSRPGSGDVGAPCTRHADCMSGVCFTGPIWPGGFCAVSCSLVTPDCPSGSSCEYRPGTAGDMGVCLPDCTGSQDCRPDYQCSPGEFHPDVSVCFAPSESLAVFRSGTGSGTVTGPGISCGLDCGEFVPRGISVTLAAAAAPGSTFTAWRYCPAPSGATCVVTMSSTKTIIALFDVVATTSTLVVTRSGTGSGTVTGGGISCGPDCSEIVAGGTSVTLTATPASGATFAGWVGCDAPSGATCGMSMSASKVVTAGFAGLCTTGATRCVAGDPGVQERCSEGAWVAEPCADWSLCAADACRAACGTAVTPTQPTLCLVPIGDGVNDGEWSMWNDGRVASPTYAVAGTQDGFGNAVGIRPAPGEAWPFVWRIGASQAAVAAFTLDQFGPYRHPALGYRARLAAVQSGASFNSFDVAGFSSNAYVTSCYTPATATTWTATACTVQTPYNQLFDYVGDSNAMFLQIDGPPGGGVIDLMDVNYLSLTIGP